MQRVIERLHRLNFETLNLEDMGTPKSMLTRHPSHRAFASNHTIMTAASLAALCAVGLSATAQAQDATNEPASVELPDVEVVTQEKAPTQQKYPSAKVVKKKPVSAAAPPTTVPKSKPSAPVASTPQNTPPAANPAPALQPVEAAAPPASVERDGVPAVATTGTLIGDREGLLDLSGSGAVVDGQELYTSHVFTTNEALRKVPGVSVRDEEGFGIRPNIGIRGLNPTRSTKTLLLEDGIFLTYAPYGDNASYFHPTMDRFAGVEIIKGTDQLLYGPQTIAGTINYTTPNPPKQPAGFAALTGGNRDYLNGQINYGGWAGNVGGLIDYVHKRGDGARDNTEHEINDVGLKGIAQISPESALIAKLNYFTEDSTVTYSGITDAEQRNFGIRYNPFKNDTFETERVGLSLTHNWDMTNQLSVATTIYYSTFDREWWRQASTTTDGQCGGAFRTARANGIAVDPDSCNSTQGRLRYYASRGIEQRWTWEVPITETIANRLKVGGRLHSEDQERFQVNIGSPIGRAGPGDATAFSTAQPGLGQVLLGENNERDVSAGSFFVQDRLQIGAFNITPIFRFEDIDFTRTNRNNGTRGTDNIQEFIPGISVGYDLSKSVAVFAGMHEGFAPPRVEDAISGTGGSVDVDAEKSINIEVGMRADVMPGLRLDATYFRNDFDNLIAVGSIAGGGVQLAEGEALFEGLELFARMDSDRIFKTPYNVYGQVAYTYLWDAEQTTPFIRVGNPGAGTPVADNTAGNRQPYAAEHLVTARIGYAQRNFDAHIEMVYIGEQFADFQNFNSAADATGATAGVANSLTGQFGKLDASTIFNVGMTYTYEPTDTDIFFSIKNVLDEEDIVDRTRGILPGAPRLFHVGVKQDF